MGRLRAHVPAGGAVHLGTQVHGRVTRVPMHALYRSPGEVVFCVGSFGMEFER